MPKSLALSIDVEDWFHVENLKAVISRESWNERELRVERNMDRLLELLSRLKVRCTAFILGWVAERCPALIRKIASEGHEIASHGSNHELVHSMTEKTFRLDLAASKILLEDLTGMCVTGYRAPNFSITDWALPVLKEMGFEYDSSQYPTLERGAHGRLSDSDENTPIRQVLPGFYEVCISKLYLGSLGLPWGGGGYFRLIPYALFRLGVERILSSGQPYVFYIHPWEIDPGQQRMKGLRPILHFRHYVNLHRSEQRLNNLIRDFHFSPICELLKDWKVNEPPCLVKAAVAASE